MRPFPHAGMGSALFISHPKVSLFSLLPKVQDNQDRLKKGRGRSSQTSKNVLKNFYTAISLTRDCGQYFDLSHVVLMSFVFVIGPTERAVLASYTMVVPARLHYQCIGANSPSELVKPNGFYNWFSLAIYGPSCTFLELIFP